MSNITKKQMNTNQAKLVEQFREKSGQCPYCGFRDFVKRGLRQKKLEQAMAGCNKMVIYLDQARGIRRRTQKFKV